MGLDLKKLAGTLTGGTGDVVSGLLNTGLSIIRDKTKDADMSFVQDKVKNGVSVSSKRMLNLAGTGAILTVALSDMATNGLSWEAIGLCAVGAAYSIVMAHLSKNS